jgi:dUTP pyrophosphatase
MFEIPLKVSFCYLDPKTLPNEGVPVQAHPGDAGVDLRADLLESVPLYPGSVVSVPTGLSMALPEEFELVGRPFLLEGQIRPRSGLGAKGIAVANTPGTIDSAYRGEIKVLLANIGENKFIINPGDRIAQLVINIIPCFKFIVVNDLDETSRSSNGFGSSGIK